MPLSAIVCYTNKTHDQSKYHRTNHRRGTSGLSSRDREGGRKEPARGIRSGAGAPGSGYARGIRGATSGAGADACVIRKIGKTSCRAGSKARKKIASPFTFYKEGNPCRLPSSIAAPRWEW